MSEFNNTLIFIDRFSKNTQVSNSMKIRLVGAELFYVDEWKDRQKDMTKPTVAIRNLTNTPKMDYHNKQLLITPALLHDSINRCPSSVI